ncbi:amidase signature enzyme [Abortiporus biennis]|nr:amidase signature enzyme [Abortiporus biennis]
MANKMRLLAKFVGVLLPVVATALASQQSTLQLTGRTLTLGNISYFVSPSPVSQLAINKDGKTQDLIRSVGQSFAGQLIPLTVISTADAKFDDRDFETTLDTFTSGDDVWSQSFLTGVFVSFTGSSRSPTTSLTFGPRQFGVQFVLRSQQYSSGIGASKSLPSGPYFLEATTGNVFQASRLYNDENQSFLYGTIPDGKGGFQQLSAHIDGAATESIAVPSRLYFTPSAKQPLAGKRLAVKDIYDVQGLHTGCGNRAFYQLYPVKNQTSPAVQRLLDGGMVLVGKTKTSQFANGEVATDDWVDLHAPYNARGDGYQDGSSSSTGSGTAMGAYEWLDYAIGSDTGGSMRGPAGANGVFGNRPSHGAVPLDDVMPLSPELDTAGIFARDAKSWAIAGHWWYKDFKNFTQFPKKILFPTDAFGSSFLTNPPRPGSANAMFNDFITQLEQFLDTNRTEINFTNLWPTTKPANSTAPSLRVLLNTTYADLITLDQTALVADPFINYYKAAHGGRMPFINPTPLTRWGYGRTLPPTQKTEALANKTQFMDWFASKVVLPDNETCSNSIFLYPQSAGGTNYRNRYTGPPSTPFGFSSGRIAVHAETPDMVVPIGEVPYNSTITGTTEFLPVTLSFIASKGCDLMLFNLFASLQDAGIIKPVATGSRLFPSS